MKTLLVLLCAIAEASYKMINLVCQPMLSANLVSQVLDRVTRFLATSPHSPRFVGISACPEIADPIREYLNRTFDSQLEVQTRLRCYQCESVNQDVLKKAEDGSIPGRFVVANMEEHFEECVKLKIEFDTEVHRPAERMTGSYYYDVSF